MIISTPDNWEMHDEEFWRNFIVPVINGKATFEKYHAELEREVLPKDPEALNPNNQNLEDNPCDEATDHLDVVAWV